MNLKNPSTAIFVKNVELSKKFYRDILGLEIEFDFGKNIIFKGGIAIWEINQNHIIPKKLGINCLYTTSNRFELYFETENIEVVYNTLQKAKATFLHEIIEEAWGQRNIRFYDPDNHLIEIGESLSCFVSRMLSNGMTKEQVSTKTGIVMEDLSKILE